ncbi:hypothetical protein HNY73_004829 [Argiope bruennichi]|uniref:Uncharacterized protein n=1 Tax=Argiope bruennichi TaxID=94029 RepID=A0A8T0FR89_ARGBR|nr:hypothetical protein HNY73_004829 [Argiope bruennichi]
MVCIKRWMSDVRTPICFIASGCGSVAFSVYDLLITLTSAWKKNLIRIFSMLSQLTFVVLCLALRESRAVDEEVETDQFIEALCETVYSCGRNVSQTFQDSMFLAAETFCDREDIRDLLFLCWEKGLSELYETSREDEVEEEISKGMNDFQACLQEILDRLFEE